MLLSSLQSDVVTSLKRGDTLRVSALRFLLAAIRNSAIAKYGAAGESSLTEEDIFGVIKKQVKSHRESIEAYQKAGRRELQQKEEAELAILSAFLPKQLSDEQVGQLLEPIIASGEKNFGLLMGGAMKAVKGQADGTRVSGILKKMLQS